MNFTQSMNSHLKLQFHSASAKLLASLPNPLHWQCQRIVSLVRLSPNIRYGNNYDSTADQILDPSSLLDHQALALTVSGFQLDVRLSISALTIKLASLQHVEMIFLFVQTSVL